jgi:general secretion pathway protein G
MEIRSRSDVFRAQVAPFERSGPGFSLVEAVIVLSVLAILAGALVPRVTNRLALSRDMRRLADMRVLQEALDKYCADHGHPPAAQENPSYGEWDVSQDGDFIPELVSGGYLEAKPVGVGPGRLRLRELAALHAGLVDAGRQRSEFRRGFGMVEAVDAGHGPAVRARNRVCVVHGSNLRKMATRGPGDMPGVRGVAVGIWVPDAPSARFWVDHGVRFVTVSNNELMLFTASSNLRQSLGK